jgi:hypothetical protein
MADAARDQLFELTDERERLFRCDVEMEDLDRDQAPAAGFVRAKNRTERACADLMENPKRPECLWRKVQD